MTKSTNTIVVSAIGARRATHLGVRFVAAFGRVYGQPTNGGKHRHPVLDAVCDSSGFLTIQNGETCATALTRYLKS